MFNFQNNFIIPDTLTEVHPGIGDDVEYATHSNPKNTYTGMPETYGISHPGDIRRGSFKGYVPH